MLSWDKGECMSCYRAAAATRDAYSASDRIPIHERVELPESWIPADSRVEIDAKITAGMAARCPLIAVLVLTHLFFPQDILQPASE